MIALEREDYERQHGRVSGAAFLRVLTTDPAFAWLKPMTALIIALDDMLEAGVALNDADRVDAVGRIRALLAPDEAGTEFQRRYADALRVMAGIAARGNIPLLAGGTMLYFHALLHGLSPSDVHVTRLVMADVVAELESLAADWGRA